MTALAVGIAFALTAISQHASAQHASFGPPKYTRCDQLPREAFTFTTLSKISSPFTVLFTNGPFSNCTREIYSAPVRGRDDYDGIVTIVKGNEVFFLKLEEDEKDNRTVYTENCSDGTKLKWYILASNFEGKQGYFCPYVCSAGGVSFDQFACKGLNVIPNPEITEKILPMVKHVPGARDIYFSHANCPPAQDCGLFNDITY